MEIKVTIPDVKRNDLALKRMDLLEKKLDQQYKSFIDNKPNYLQIVEQLQSSFMNRFDKMLMMHKSMTTQRNQERIDILRKEFERKIKSLEGNKDNKQDIKL